MNIDDYRASLRAHYEATWRLARGLPPEPMEPSTLRRLMARDVSAEPWRQNERTALATLRQRSRS